MDKMEEAYAIIRREMKIRQYDNTLQQAYAEKQEIDNYVRAIWRIMTKLSLEQQEKHKQEYIQENPLMAKLFGMK